VRRSKKSLSQKNHIFIVNATHLHPGNGTVDSAGKIRKEILYNPVGALLAAPTDISHKAPEKHENRFNRKNAEDRRGIPYSPPSFIIVPYGNEGRFFLKQLFTAANRRGGPMCPPVSFPHPPKP
jgi:hypothetical protein